MTDRSIEKTLLYLVILSVVLHLTVYQLVRLIPKEKPKLPPEATVVDLTDLPKPPERPLKAKEEPKPKLKKAPKPKPVPPAKPKLEPPKPPPLPKEELPKPPPPPKPEPAQPLPHPKPVEVLPKPVAPIPVLPRQPRLGDRTERTDKEVAPKGDREQGHVTSPKKPQPPGPPKAPVRRFASEQPVRKAEQGGLPLEKGGTVPVARGEGLFRAKPKDGAKTGAKEGISRAKLFPTGKQQARLEESYRMKYLKEVEEGKAFSLNTDDIRLASFTRRFSDAAYSIWHYPKQALLQHISGSTLVKITFKRDGEITNVELMESSGSKILDDEVFRTLSKMGPIGPLPQKYQEETLPFVVLFIYTLEGGLTYY